MRWCKWGGVLLLATLSGMSCAADQTRPATISFTSFDHVPDGYRVRFVSDADLARREGEMRVGEWLVCELDGDADFSIEHRISQFARGDIMPDQEAGAVTSEGQWPYYADVDFYRTLDQGTSEQYLESRDVVELLAGRDAITCKVVMTIYLGDPYYSRSMEIPVDQILVRLEQMPW